MPSVRVSGEHDMRLENAQDKHSEQTGVTPTKKQLVENAIDSYFGDGQDGE